MKRTVRQVDADLAFFYLACRLQTSGDWDSKWYTRNYVRVYCVCTFPVCLPGDALCYQGRQGSCRDASKGLAWGSVPEMKRESASVREIF